jgi:hypothetical protein
VNTLLGATTVLVVLLWLFRRRRAAAVAGFFILFSLITRTLALIYVDLAGPIYAIELEEEVGGGQSMPLFATSVLLFLVPLGFMFRRSALVRLLPSSDHPAAPRYGVRHTTFVCLTAFVLALFGDMVTRGPIPLLEGIDRLEYGKDFAGPLHTFIMQQGFLFAGLIGVMMVAPRVAGRDFDFRFLGLFVAIMIYFALTGNRFSAFYAFTSFFVIPFAAIPALAAVGRLAAPRGGRGALTAFLCSRIAIVAALCALAFALASLVINSLVTVRGYDDPMEQFAQRTLVQPVQLWWTTWRDLQERSANATLAWDAAFFNPIDPTRNTSIQVLMIKNLGGDRAAELLDAGQQYAGGYPEILVELIGPWLAMPVALTFGLVTAWMLRLVVVSTAHGRVGTAFLAVYVFYGFSLLYIGGMLNFLLVWTFWAKCGLLAIVAPLERTALRRRSPAGRQQAPTGGT